VPTSQAYVGIVRALVVSLLAATITVPSALAASAPALPAASTLAGEREVFLDLARAGVRKTQQLWWNDKQGWYNSRLGVENVERPLPALWYAFPMFEAVAAVAIAEPTAVNKAAVDVLASRAVNYWDPTIAGGAGAFSWYFGLRGTGNAYFDDNGWWGIAFVDAYRATGNKKWLAQAARALGFIDRFGWDAKGGGGVWWDLEHHHKTSEPLAAATLIAAELYRFTGDELYLRMATKYLAWADAKTVNSRQSDLYARSDTDATVMNYVEGMMISAHIELCRATARTWYCGRAQELAKGSLNEFPILADWAPETDVIYLRGLVDLYAYDRDPRWYAVVYANADRARKLARDDTGLWSKRWDGGWTLPGALYTQAATLQLFAWLGVSRPPSE
jgi:uncharacterized protein YyaL (SSP411 family)